MDAQRRQPSSEGNGRKRGKWRRWLWLALLGFLLLQGSCLVILPMAASAGSNQMLPVSIRALDEADYSVDPLGTSQPPLQFAIVGDVLRDVDPEATDIDSRMSALEEAMRTPVAPEGDPTGTPGATASATHTTEPSPSSTGTVGLTATASLTSSQTAIPSTTPTGTILASSTPTGTVPPSTTPATPSATPTKTASPAPTSTSSPTPVPPTATPSDVSCTMFDLSGFRVDKKRVTWDLNNNSGQDAEITAIFIVWPGSNKKLKKIELSDDPIWEGEDDNPPTFINGGWKSGGSREIEAGESEPLMFQFDEEATSSDYNLRIDLDNDCQVDS